MEPARCWTVPSPTHSHRITRMGLVGQGAPSHPRPRIPTPPSFPFSFFSPPLFSFYFHFFLPTGNSRPGDTGLYLREGSSQKVDTYLAFNKK